MFAKIQYFFLQKYENSDFITMQRVKILLRICLILTFVIFTLVASYIIQGQNDMGIILPISISGLILIVCITLIKYGYFYIAAHTILVVSTSAVWTRKAGPCLNALTRWPWSSDL
jgi:hypothetical protein